MCTCMQYVCAHMRARVYKCTHRHEHTCGCICDMHGDIEAGVLDADEVKAAGDLAAVFHLPATTAAHTYDIFSL